jgi:hypothetical protein
MLDLTQDQVQKLLDLVQQIFEQGRAFKVFPPKQVTHNQAILTDPAVAEKLAGTKWWLRFHNGDEALLEFVELLALVYQVRETRRQLGEAKGNVTVSVGFSVAQLLGLAPELLASIDLVGIARAPFVATYPLFALYDAEGGLVCSASSEDTVGFVFTSETNATAFARVLGHGRALRIADDAAAFKALLRKGSANVVAFDPIAREEGVEVTTLLPVDDILNW